MTIHEFQHNPVRYVERVRVYIVEPETYPGELYDWIMSGDYDGTEHPFGLAGQWDKLQRAAREILTETN